MVKPLFEKRVLAIVNNAPADMNTFSTVADVDGDHRPDFVLSGRQGKLVWLENRGKDVPWIVHEIDDVVHMECGGVLCDLTGSGLPDLINGSDWQGDEVLWWENTGKTDERWIKRVIAKTGYTQFHDTLIADVTGDGTLSLLFTNQHGPGGTTLYRVPVPSDPRQSPWPELEVVASGLCEGNNQPEEGLAVGDIDGDGTVEIVCGTHWFKYDGNGRWKCHKYASGYITTKVVIGDLDGDGRSEIVLSEGDPCVYGQDQGGKLGWFKPGKDVTDLWTEHRIDDLLLDAHSLQMADLCGNGRMDLFAAEVGKADKQTDAYVGHEPRLMIYENDGAGSFVRHILDEGTGTHEALLVDLEGRGVLDIIGKPLHGEEKWSVHAWYRVL